MLHGIAFDEVAQLGLIDGAALLLLHNVVPYAYVWLAFENDGNSWADFVVINHREIIAIFPLLSNCPAKARVKTATL